MNPTQFMGRKQRLTARFPRVLSILTVLWAIPPDRAEANFRFCNQTLDVANVAVGEWDVDDWATSGWWVVGPNQCANLIETPLTARFVYVFAMDVFNKPLLKGTTTLCVMPDEFDKIRGHDTCLTVGRIPAEFLEVDTRRSERWTFFLSAPE